MRKYVILLVTVASAIFWFREEKVELGPGVLAPEVPKQIPLKGAIPIVFEDYTITPLAGFSVKAKVLSKENYWFGREADLSPVDLALGWGRMSDEEILKDISISQSGRWYSWRVKAFPIPRREIETHSANMHMIPTNRDIEDSLKKIKSGQLVQLHGKLVRVDAKDGWHWISSLTREDTGGRSCELVYVEGLRVLEL